MYSLYLLQKLINYTPVRFLNSIYMTEMEFLEFWGKFESVLDQNQLRDPPSPTIWKF